MFPVLKIDEVVGDWLFPRTKNINKHQDHRVPSCSIRIFWGFSPHVWWPKIAISCWSKHHFVMFLWFHGHFDIFWWLHPHVCLTLFWWLNPLLPILAATCCRPQTCCTAKWPSMKPWSDWRRTNWLPRVLGGWMIRSVVPQFGIAKLVNATAISLGFMVGIWWFWPNLYLGNHLAVMFVSLEPLWSRSVYLPQIQVNTELPS